MRSWEDPGPSSDAIRKFVSEHFARDPRCDEAQLVNGWRVRFGRPLYSTERTVLMESYRTADMQRQMRLKAAEAARKARMPQGPIQHFVAMGWPGQLTLGLTLLLYSSYSILGIEELGRALLYLIVLTHIAGFGAVAGLSWFIGRAIIHGLRHVVRYWPPPPTS